MELRKAKEKELHNAIRNEGLIGTPQFEDLTSNKKWYSVTRKSRGIIDSWLSNRCVNKKVLDYCCGNGGMSFAIAKMGAREITGIDISDISVENATRHSRTNGLTNTKFLVMDAENMQFEDGSFDIIQESGVLHHLQLEKAYSELARVLKPGGGMICNEALAHNPLIHYYRKRTPRLRTNWEVEHIFRKKDIFLANKYFNKVEVLGFYHLSTLAAVPFRNGRAFNSILSIFETLDNILLRLPFLKWQAWQVVFVLSEPKNKK
jgi:ubiquinone/menaquinone biosynthesis C-methylase UbiE